MRMFTVITCLISGFTIGLWCNVFFDRARLYAAPAFPSVGGFSERIGFSFAHEAFVLNGPGCIDTSGLKHYNIFVQSVCVRHKGEGNNEFQDDFSLIFNFGDSKRLFYFESSYPYKLLSMHVIPNSSSMFVLLIHPEGRGTAAVSVSLDVYMAKKENVSHVGRYIIANYFGPSSMWWYHLKKFYFSNSKLPSYFPAIHFSLEHDPIGADPLQDKRLIPKLKSFCIILSPEGPKELYGECQKTK